MIKRFMLYILEHGAVPAVALALAISPANSRSSRYGFPRYQALGLFPFDYLGVVLALICKQCF
jgi:hypothetical protein